MISKISVFLGAVAFLWGLSIGDTGLSFLGATLAVLSLLPPGGSSNVRH